MERGHIRLQHRYTKFSLQMIPAFFSHDDSSLIQESEYQRLSSDLLSCLYLPKRLRRHLLRGFCTHVQISSPNPSERLSSLCLPQENQNSAFLGHTSFS